MKNSYIKLIVFMAILVSLLIPVGLSFEKPEEAKAGSAGFYLSPSSGSFKVGQTVSISLMIDSGGQAINSGEGSLSFASDVLKFQSVSSSGSIFTFWTNGPTGGDTSVSFGGGLSSPGYTGSAGKVLSVEFKVLKIGNATIDVNGSKILANDGLGTNVLGGNSGGSYTVEAPKVVKYVVSVESPSHPEQESWYADKNVSLKWSANSVSGYVFDFTQSASTNPKGSISKETEKIYENTEDGIWYFHVKARGDDYGPTTHFKTQIDTIPPEEFEVTVDQGEDNLDTTPIITFEVTDLLSGMDRVEVVIDGGEPVLINSGDELPHLHPGIRTLVVKAYDKAGNVREVTKELTIEGIYPPIISQCSMILALLDPVVVKGYSHPDDRILVFIDNKEVDNFLAKDNAIDAQIEKIYTEDEKYKDWISWEYKYDKILNPGTYNIRLSRIETSGKESYLTEPCKLLVVFSSIKVGKYVLPTWVIVTIMLLLIIILLYTIYRLQRKIRSVMKSKGYSMGNIFGTLKRSLSSVEKKIDKDIDENFPDSDLPEKVVKKLKEDLKEDVHEAIEDEEELIDQVSGSESPKKPDNDENS